MRIQATLVFVALSALCAFAQDSKLSVTPPSSSIPAKKTDCPDPVEEAKKARSQPNKPWFRWPKPGEEIQPAMIDGALVEQDEPYVTAAIKTIDDPEIRIGFRLAFLRYSLKKYEQELTKPPAAPKIRAAAAQSSGPK